MKPATKGPKTNAMRVLDAHHVAYQVHYYSPEVHSADEVARIVDAAPTQVFKTLVLSESGSGRPLLVMVPANAELDLKLLAQQPGVGEKRLRMATQREAESLTGLLVGGISPLALLQKGFRVFIDDSVLQLDRVYVSGGQRGVNLSLAAADLLKVTRAVPVAAASPL
ncbi:MAG: aminoacyl-tRNA deacylase [Chloroflexota bacterium]|nr:aminoacyl-tRNA deacylase [Chloroflexota bacterium]